MSTVDEYIQQLVRNVSADENIEENINKKTLRNDYIDLFKDNRWLRHFNNIYINDGWVDFETQIFKVIQTLDAIRKFVYERIKDGAKKDSIQFVRQN